MNASAPTAAATDVSQCVHPNTIIVSQRQHGNPVLRSIRNVPWRYGHSTADYVLSDSTCALFLSLRYHTLHPTYLSRRLLQLSPCYSLRLVLLLVDTEFADVPVLEVTRIAILHDASSLLAWSVAEAARYLETLRAYARKPADLIKERSDGGFVSQLAECLTLVRPLSRSDVATLQATYGSLANIVRASDQELAACPGLGERKVRRLRQTFTEPFVGHGPADGPEVGPDTPMPKPATDSEISFMNPVTCCTRA